MPSDPESTQALAAVIFFTACPQAVLVSPVLHLLFDDRWDGSIPLSQLLSIGLAFDAVCWVAGALVNARGEFRKLFVFHLFFAPCFFSLVGLGAWLSHAPGVAMGVVLYYSVYAPCYSYLAMRGRVGAPGIFGLYLPPLMLAGSAVIAGFALAHFLFDRYFPIPQITAILIFATIFYSILLRLCMPETSSAIKAQATSLFSRLSRGG
jgi:O-antigen/teichoic acid export membrane protein